MKLLLAFFLFTSIIINAQSEEVKEKKDIISQFILGDNLDFASESFFERQIQSVMSSHPELSDSVWESVRLNVDCKDSFKDAVIELYENKLTLDDLREIKKAFEIPEMRKMKVIEKEVLESFPTTAVKVGRDIINNINDYLKKYSNVNTN